MDCKKRKRKRKRWCVVEDGYLRDNYLVLSVSELSVYLGRTEKAVTRRAQTLGVATKTNKITIATVKDSFLINGFTLLENNYTNATTQMSFVCSNGHHSSITWNKFQNGRGCSKCYYNSDDMYATISNKFDSVGYNLVTTAKEYRGSKHPLQFVCPRGHHHHICWDSFNSGSRCGKCKPGYSKAEVSIRNFISSLGFEVESNTRNLIQPYEIDIYVPEVKLALEYCGLRWHGEKFSSKPRNYHRKKLDMCAARGIRLITIFEDEYIQRPSVVLSRVRQALGVITDRLYARKLDLVEVSLTEARDFLSEHHLQGYSPCSYRFALKDGDRLVQVITFGSLSRHHAGKNGKTVELKRLASLSGTSVVGGASRLFKFALLRMAGKFKYVKSYCDRRWSQLVGDTVYDKLGFKVVSETKYTPHYIKRQKRYRNQSLRKTKEEQSLGLTEWELRLSQGYDRIWDCGHVTYTYTI